VSISLAPLQPIVDNALPDEVAGGLIGLVGDRPSVYSRSPQIWTAALRGLGIEAAYLPLDVQPGRLGDLLAALREVPGWWGANVTVPFKGPVIALIDEVVPATEGLGVVNTITRRPDGRLVGANTDGVGAVAALLHGGPGGPLVDTLYGQTVLLIGAGGAARASAVALAQLLGSGELLVMSRTVSRAEEVAAQARAAGGRVRVINEDSADDWLGSVDVVINASTRGQAGILRRPDGWTCLEPYSAMAPASPAVLPPAPEDEFLATWRARSRRDIEANHARSRTRMRHLSPHAVLLDMVYAPPETVTMRHAREVGLRAANGRWMMIVQAAEACVGHICARTVASMGTDRDTARREAVQAMAMAWPTD
jgi:shikimate dehydrogenase